MNRYLSLLATCVIAKTALAAAPQVQPWGVYLSYIDKSVKPGDDFYNFANGNWQETAQIPADRFSSGVYLDVDLRNAGAAQIHPQRAFNEQRRHA
jgi:putative endopeptidase